MAVASQSGKRKVILVLLFDFFRVVFCEVKFAFNYSPAQHAVFFLLSSPSSSSLLWFLKIVSCVCAAASRKLAHRRFASSSLCIIIMFSLPKQLTSNVCACVCESVRVAEQLRVSGSG